MALARQLSLNFDGPVSLAAVRSFLGTSRKFDTFITRLVTANFEIAVAGSAEVKESKDARRQLKLALQSNSPAVQCAIKFFSWVAHDWLRDYAAPIVERLFLSRKMVWSSLDSDPLATLWLVSGHTCRCHDCKISDRNPWEAM